jgi:hypothetical protein
MDPEQTPALDALSRSERSRLNGYLRSGQAPQNPRISAAVVEWGERCQRKAESRKNRLLRWSMPVFVVILAVEGVNLANQGFPISPLRAAVSFLTAAFISVHLVRSPMMRPKRIARSVDASREATSNLETSATTR